MTEELRLSEREFKLFRQFIYDEVGIALAPHKISLVQGRLSKRLRQLGMTRFTEYYDYLQNDRGGEEIFQLVNAISTNVTSFFREPGQWDFLRENLQERLDAKKEKRLRIWSAACSSGEEPYSIAMFLKDTVPDFTRWDIRILATDISKKVLSKAVAGRYREKDVEGMPKKMLLSHFERIKGADGAVSYQIDDDLRNLVTFRMFNLVHGDFSLFRLHGGLRGSPGPVSSNRPVSAESPVLREDT